MCEPTATFMFGIWEVMLEEDNAHQRAVRVGDLIDALMKKAAEVYGKDSDSYIELKHRLTEYYLWLESTRPLLYIYTPPWERQPSDLYRAHQRTQQDLYYFGRIRDFCDPVGK
jgi:hypothetical protein